MQDGYYIGMMNASASDVRHWRTKNSRNGYSTTPGYIAIGKPANKEAYLNNRPRFNVYNLFGRQVRTARLLGNAYRNYSPIVAKGIGKAANNIGQYASGIASNIPKAIKKYTSQVADDVRNIPKSIGNVGKQLSSEINKDGRMNQYIGKSAKAKAFMVGRKAITDGYNYISNKWNAYQDGPVMNEDYKSIVRDIVRRAGNIEEYGGWDRINKEAEQIYKKNKKHNELRKAYKDAEAYYNKVSKEYDDFNDPNASRSTIEKLNRKVEDAYNKFFEAEQAYRAFR